MAARLATRMHDDLKRAVATEATRLGVTQSEFVRAALVAHLAWHQALDTVEDGARVEDLRDPAVVARLLGRR
jgi:hypothetical protein